MKLPNLGPLFTDPTNRRSCSCNLFPAAAFLCIVFFIISAIVTFDYKEKISLEPAHSIQTSQSSHSNLCKSQCIPSGTEPLPKGIVSRTSNLEMQPLWASRRSPNIKGSSSQGATPSPPSSPLPRPSLSAHSLAVQNRRAAPLAPPAGGTRAASGLPYQRQNPLPRRSPRARLTPLVRPVVLRQPPAHRLRAPPPAAIGVQFLPAENIAKISLEPVHSIQTSQSSHSNLCKSQCIPSGTEPLPKGIVSRTSNLEMRPLWVSRRSPNIKVKANLSKSLLAIPVGIKQKEVVNQIVMKFPSSNFTVMLFHYDGVMDEWRDLQWSDTALHISAINQTKWWFAKRFLHPDIVAEYDYIFLWDEDLDVEHFHPGRYLSIVKREGLEISQPGLDTGKSQVHHRITGRWRKGDVHRRIYKFSGGGRCYENSTAPPCTGWVEMMAPVFSRAAWRCTWHMIQNDLIHAWGLDMKLGYCAQGDRSKNVGVVDSEYIAHKGIPTLGGPDDKAPPGLPASKERLSVRMQSYAEQETFKKRWRKAIKEDECWIDPYL